VSDADERDLRRFRRLVRSKIREHAQRQKEAPGLTLWVSAGARSGKCAPVRIGAASSAADVAVRARAAMLEAAPSFAAIGRPLHSKADRRVGRRYGLVVASASGLVETWQTTFTAGTFSAWEVGEFDPGATVDLLRSAWAELERRGRLQGLLRRLEQLAVEPLEDELENASRWSKCAELAEGLESFLGNPLAEAPREPESEFAAYVEAWLQHAEVHGV
jgi:hypothetical protein